MYGLKRLDFRQHPRGPAAQLRAHLALERLEDRQVLSAYDPLSAYHPAYEVACPSCGDIWDGSGGTVELCCWIKDTPPFNAPTNSIRTGYHDDARGDVGSLGHAAIGVLFQPLGVVLRTGLADATPYASDHRDHDLPADSVSPRATGDELGGPLTRASGNSSLQGTEPSVSRISPRDQGLFKGIAGPADRFWMRLASGREALPNPSMTPAAVSDLGSLTPWTSNLP
jgi:hypothetical protein